MINAGSDNSTAPEISMGTDNPSVNSMDMGFPPMIVPNKNLKQKEESIEDSGNAVDFNKGLFIVKKGN
jgi:hypothetical protein